MKDVLGRDATRLKDKKLYLLDMDGTIYLGNILYKDTPAFLKGIDDKGARYVFITNNASKSVVDYVKKLHNLGLTHITEEHFLTSADVAFDLMKEKFGNKLIYVQGTNSLVTDYKKKGLNITTEYNKDAKAILVGFDPEFTGEKVITTCKMLTELDVPYYATNPDWVCPVEFGYIPDCGSMCQSYERATGKKPYFIGKPRPEMVLHAMKKFGVSKEDTVVIGDRLYTDVASGNNAGVDSVCVLSGEVTYEETIKAEGSEKPTFILNGIGDIKF
jgi:HAD superfamily hydrolase (TIGR01450 family)